MFKRLFQLISYNLVVGLISFLVTPVIAQNNASDVAKNPQMPRVESSPVPALASQTWPEEPLTIGDNALKAWVFLPKPGSPANDPLQEISLGGELRGKLVYIPSIVSEDRAVAQQFFIFRGIGVTGTIAGQETGAANYIASGGDTFFDPQFSPDNSCLVFKNGDPYFRYGGYQLYLWDFKAKQVRQVAASLSYPLISWSWDSNYLTYIEGGDMNGNETDFSGQVYAPLQLHIYNRRTGQNQVVAQNPQVMSHAWTRQGTLLFTQLKKLPFDAEKTDDAGKAANANAKDGTPTHSDIYEVAAEGGPSKLVVSDAYEPSPSPDGKWIAFLGWPAAPMQEKAENTEPRSQHEAKVEIPGVYLFDRALNQRVFVGLLRSPHAPTKLSPAFALRWTPDSQRLLITEAAYTARRANLAQGTLTIRIVNISPQINKLDGEGIDKELVTLKAEDFEAVLRSSPRPQFEPLQVTQDGKFLLVKESEYTGRDHGFLTELKSLQAVDLQNGHTSIVARIQNKWGSVIGWDWHDESIREEAIRIQASK